MSTTYKEMACLFPMIFIVFFLINSFPRSMSMLMEVEMNDFRISMMDLVPVDLLAKEQINKDMPPGHDTKVTSDQENKIGQITHIPSFSQRDSADDEISSNELEEKPKSSTSNTRAKNISCVNVDVFDLSRSF